MFGPNTLKANVHTTKLVYRVLFESGQAVPGYLYLGFAAMQRQEYANALRILSSRNCFC